MPEMSWLCAMQKRDCPLVLQKRTGYLSYKRDCLLVIQKETEYLSYKKGFFTSHTKRLTRTERDWLSIIQKEWLLVIQKGTDYLSYKRDCPLWYTKRNMIFIIYKREWLFIMQKWTNYLSIKIDWLRLFLKYNRVRKWGHDNMKGTTRVGLQVHTTTTTKW